MTTKPTAFSLALALASLPAAAPADDVVYDNLATPLGESIGFPFFEVADDMSLGPGSRVFSSAEIAYTGLNFDGDEMMTLNLYEMDGPPTSGSFGFNTPGTLLYSATQSVAGGATTTTFTDLSGAVILPDFLGVGLSFSGVDFASGEDAGPLLYDPPAVGSSFLDYWRRDSPEQSAWALFDDPPENFGVRILTGASVPDAGGTLALASLALGGCLALAGRRSRR